MLIDDPSKLHLFEESVDLGIKKWRGGPGLFIVWVTAAPFDFPKVQLEMSPDDGVTWVWVGQCARFTRSGCAAVVLPTCKVRATVGGLFGTSKVSAMYIRLPT